MRRCLEKDRSRRLADIADAPLELDDAQSASPTDVAAVQSASRRREWLILYSALALVAGAASIGWMRERASTPPPPPETRLEIATPPTTEPASFALSPDGQALYYLAPDGTVMAAPIAAKEATFEPGAPAALFRPRIVKGGSVVIRQRHQYDVAPDGRFLINVIADDASAAPITVIQSWAGALDAKK